MKTILILLLAVFLTACTRPDTAKRVLEAQGYTQIQTTGYSWFGCGEDLFSDKFTARGPIGQPVSGVVCSGVLKNSTVRLD